MHEVDTATHDVVHSVGVGVEPDAVAVAPGGTGGKGIALVANLDSNTVTPVDLGSWRAGRRWRWAASPWPSRSSWRPRGRRRRSWPTSGATRSHRSTSRPCSRAPPSPSVRARRRSPWRPERCSSATSPTARSLRSTPATLHAGGSVALPLNPTGIAVAPSGNTAYVCGGQAVVPVTTLGLVLGCTDRPPRRGAGDRAQRRRRDGVGDGAGGIAGPGHTGHGHGRPAGPSRRPPVRHRRRSRLSPSRTVAAA